MSDTFSEGNWYIRIKEILWQQYGVDVWKKPQPKIWKFFQYISSSVFEHKPCLPGCSQGEITITPRVCSAWESQVHSSICCCWEDEQWFYPSAIAHFCTDQLFAAVCHPFHDEPKHIYWAPPRCHGPECRQNSPKEAGASSPGCRANCSALSWPHVTATTASRREQEISFLNIRPFATIPMLPTRHRFQWLCHLVGGGSHWFIFDILLNSYSQCSRWDFLRQVKELDSSLLLSLVRKLRFVCN